MRGCAVRCARQNKGRHAGDLTPRERDIMRLVARGMDNREIAGALFLAEGTVRNNISRLLEKLKLKDRTSWLYLQSSIIWMNKNGPSGASGHSIDLGFEGFHRYIVLAGYQYPAVFII